MKRKCFVAKDLLSRDYAAFEIDVGYFCGLCRPLVVCNTYVRGRTRFDVVQALKVLSIGVTARSRLERTNDPMKKLPMSRSRL